MTIVIVTILIIGYFLIATEKYTNVNKAAGYFISATAQTSL